jgi:ketosteroid isomerase-like protein
VQSSVGKIETYEAASQTAISDTLSLPHPASGSPQTWSTALKEDTQWHFIGDRTLSGKDMVRQWMAETYREPPRFEVNHLISEGDWLTALGDITTKDDEGNEVCYAYCDVWRFEGDKLAELRAFVIRPTIPE